MDTVQADKVTTVGLNYLEVEGATLLELLEGVSTHASKDKHLTVLNALQVEGEGGLFIARATDRYRLIEGSIKAIEGQLDPAIISLEDIKRVITLAKAHKAHIIKLHRVTNTLTVSSLGETISFYLVEDNYPPTADLLSKVESDPIAVEGVAFNPVFFTDYAKIAGKGAAIKVYFGGEGKPMRVRITSNTITWRALLMPMRYVD